MSRKPPANRRRQTLGVILSLFALSGGMLVVTSLFSVADRGLRGAVTEVFAPIPTPVSCVGAFESVGTDGTLCSLDCCSQSCIGIPGEDAWEYVCSCSTDGFACNSDADCCGGLECGLSGTCGLPDLCAGVTCDAPTQCQASNTCDSTIGQCVALNAPNGQSCDDNDALTVNDKCTEGECHGEDLCVTNNVTCVALSQCHDVGVCDPTTGLCSNPLKTEGTECDDDNLCTQTDICIEGSCIGTNEVSCEAVDCLSDGFCDSWSGYCYYNAAPEGTSCAYDAGTCDAGGSCVIADTGGSSSEIVSPPPLPPPHPAASSEPPESSSSSSPSSSSSSSVTIGEPTLYLTNTASPSFVSPGDSITFVVRASNYTLVPSFAPVITLTLPDGLTVDPLTISPALDPDAPPGVLQWKLSTIWPLFQGEQMTVTATVESWITREEPLVALASHALSPSAGATFQVYPDPTESSSSSFSSSSFSFPVSSSASFSSSLESSQSSSSPVTQPVSSSSLSSSEPPVTASSASSGQSSASSESSPVSCALPNAVCSTEVGCCDPQTVCGWNSAANEHRCITCGNGTIDAGLGEQCEPGNVGLNTCVSRGFDGGSLACSDVCAFNTDSCTTLPVEVLAHQTLVGTQVSATVRAGQTLTYRVTVRNPSVSAATNVLVTNDLPSGLLNPSTTGPGQFFGGDFSYVVPFIAPGDTQVFTMTATVPTTASAGTPYNAVAAVGTSTRQASATVIEAGMGCIVIRNTAVAAWSQSSSKPAITAMPAMTYQLDGDPAKIVTTDVNGNAVFANIVLSETDSSANVHTVTQIANGQNWAIASGTPAAQTVTVVEAADASAGNATGCVSAQFANEELVSPVTVQKAAALPKLAPLQEMDFTITLANADPRRAVPVTVFDTLPPLLSYVSLTMGGVNEPTLTLLNNATVAKWNVTVPAGGTRTYVMRVKAKTATEILAAANGGQTVTVSNTANIQGGGQNVSTVILDATPVFGCMDIKTILSASVNPRPAFAFFSGAAGPVNTGVQSDVVLPDVPLGQNTLTDVPAAGWQKTGMRWWDEFNVARTGNPVVITQHAPCVRVELTYAPIAVTPPPVTPPTVTPPPVTPPTVTPPTVTPPTVTPPTVTPPTVTPPTVTPPTVTPPPTASGLSSASSSVVTVSVTSLPSSASSSSVFVVSSVSSSASSFFTCSTCQFIPAGSIADCYDKSAGRCTFNFWSPLNPVPYCIPNPMQCGSSSSAASMASSSITSSSSVSSSSSSSPTSVASSSSSSAPACACIVDCSGGPVCQNCEAGSATALLCDFTCGIAFVTSCPTSSVSSSSVSSSSVASASSSSASLHAAAPVCGNGIKEGTEGCDDGNLTNFDTCDSNCTEPSCGNGIVSYHFWPPESCTAETPCAIGVCNGSSCVETCDDTQPDCQYCVRVASASSQSSSSSSSSDSSSSVSSTSSASSVSSASSSSLAPTKDLLCDLNLGLAPAFLPDFDDASVDSTRYLVLFRPEIDESDSDVIASLFKRGPGDDPAFDGAANAAVLNTARDGAAACIDAKDGAICLQGTAAAHNRVCIAGSANECVASGYAVFPSDGFADCCALADDQTGCPEAQQDPAGVILGTEN